MANSLANSFGLVFLFGVFLILLCLQSQDNVITVVAPRKWLETAHTDDNNNSRIESINDDPATTTAAATDVNTFPPDTSNDGERVTEGSEAPWPYDSPILQGWEPEKTRNLSVYLQPEINTTLIMPRLVFLD